MSDVVQLPTASDNNDNILVSTTPSIAPLTGNISIAPRLSIKQEESQAIAGVGITTTKEWIIPPRPKPGRKPATDTPPTKRKAQNREAQRSFRERRSARVSELEEQLKKVEADAETRENAYQSQISRITAENNQLRATVTDLRRDIEALQRTKADSQVSVCTSSPYLQSTLTQVASPAPSLNTESVEALSGEYLNNARPGRQSQSHNVFNPDNSRRTVPTSAEIIEIEDDEDDAFSTRPEGCCGGTQCGKPGGCTSFLDSIVSLHHTHKRSITPDTLVTKRSRYVNNHSELETDFTEVYMATKKKPKEVDQPSMSPASDIIMPDSCGFCSDGTLCLCAEMAKTERGDIEQKADRTINSTERQILPPILDMDPLETLTAVTISTLQDRLEPLHPPPTTAIEGCTGQPGTCKQCQNDPMSTLFCRTLASRMKDINASADGACCGGTACGKNAASIKSVPLPKESIPTESPTTIRLPGINEDSAIYIPCSAAYQTLSRHKRFEEASADLGQLVGKLNTKGMQVEVSSVRDVLKYLDREFGKNSA